MSRLALFASVAVLSCGAALSGQDAKAGPDVAKLIQQLDDDEWDSREAATAKLMELWQDPSLRERLLAAREGGSAEMRSRCDQVLAGIDLRRAIGGAAWGEVEAAIGKADLAEFEKADVLGRCALLDKFAGRVPEEERTSAHWQAIWMALATAGVKDLDAGQRAELMKEIQPQGWQAAKVYVPFLCVALFSDAKTETTVRTAAIDGLAIAGARDRAKSAVPLLKDADAEVRAHVAWMLGRFSAKEYASDIIPLLKDPSPQVRINAEEALRECGVDPDPPPK